MKLSPLLIIIITCTFNVPECFSLHQMSGKHIRTQTLSRSAMEQILLAEFSVWRGDIPLAIKYYRQSLSFQSSSSVAERMTRLALHELDYEGMLFAASAWSEAAPTDANARFFKSLAASYSDLHELAITEMQENLSMGESTDFTRLVNQLDRSRFASEAELNQVVSLYNKFLLESLANYPQSYDLPLALALLALLQQRFKFAIEMAGVARDKAPSNSSVIQFAMRIFDTAGDAEELIICYQLLLKINPDNDVLRHRFAVFLADQFSDQAIEQLLVLHQAHPENASYLFHLSLLYINTRQFDDARTALTRLRGFAYYEDEANYYLGWMALDQGDGDQAERYLLRVQSPHLLIQRYQALLDVYLLQRKFNQAVQQTYLLEPLLYNDSAAVNYLSQSSLLTALGDFDAALLALEKVEAINDQLSQIYYRRAVIFRQQGKLSQSEQVMKYFITLEPNDAASMHILGRWLAEDDRQYRQAVVWLERASEVDSESAAILEDLGWLLLKLNRIAEAKSYLAKAQELVEDAQVAAHFAEVLWRSGDQSRAKELLKEAFTQSPRDKVLAETIRRLDVVLD